MGLISRVSSRTYRQNSSNPHFPNSSNPIMARRPNFVEFQKQVQFQHDKFPPEKFLIMHPTTRTENCDVVVLPETPDPSSNKMVVIPADKSILRMITYFNAQLNENHTWKETDQNEK